MFRGFFLTTAIFLSSLIASYDIDHIEESEVIIMSSSDEPMREYITNDNIVIDTKKRCFNISYWQRVVLRTVYFIDTQRALKKERRIVFDNNESCIVRAIERIY